MSNTVPHTNTYTIGKGKIYFDKFDASGVKQGRRYLGNTPGFTISVTTEKLQHYSSSGGLKEKDKEVTVSIDRSANITVDDMSADNLALFVIGDLSTHAQGSGSVADEALTVPVLDRFYQLGESVSNPTGVRNITNVVVQDDTDTTTYVLDTDYKMDLEMGLIFIMASGSISADDVLHIDYDTPAENRNHIKTASTPIDGALHFVADNPSGDNNDVFGPEVTLSPTGELPMIGEEFLSMQFEVAFNSTNDNYEALYIDGRAA